jgi:hypothetical protein
MQKGGGRLGEERERVRVGAAGLHCNFRRAEGLFAKLAGGGAGASAARHVDREMRGAKETTLAFHFSDATTRILYISFLLILFSHPGGITLKETCTILKKLAI